MADWIGVDMPHALTDLERFWKFAQKDATGCWLWVGGSGSYNSNGYGRFSHRGVRVMAHRWSYEQFVGPIGRGLELDHLCRVRQCVNPEHLEPVTRQENMRRCPDDAASINARKTHCIYGHEFTAENTIVRPDGRRNCRPCRRAYAAKTSAV